MANMSCGCAWALGMIRAVALSVVLSVPGFGCGGKSGSGTGRPGETSTGAFAEPCIDGTECQEDLICAQAGIAEGLCSRLCAESSECQVLFGEAASCDASACVLRCQTHDDCPASSRCDEVGGACRQPTPEEIEGSGVGNLLVDNLVVSNFDKLDLLFMIDNSMGMGDKQRLLARALPDLVVRLVDPRCLDSQGGETAKQLNGECPTGSALEFRPFNNIHIGVITSSLGGFGAELTCNNTDRATGQVDVNMGQADVAHLLGSLPRGQGVGETSTSHAFLSWCVSTALENGECAETVESGTALAGGSTAGNLNRFVSAFQYQVVFTGETGCGFEASLEAWYRFLVEPSPWVSIVRQPCSPTEAEGMNLCVGPSTVGSVPLVREGIAEIDSVILEQRKAFLRPDSLLTIVMLTDENDCSFKVTGQAWTLSTIYMSSGAGNIQRRMAFKGTAQCQVNPNDPCCYSCGLPPRVGCPSEVNLDGTPVGQGCSDRVYESSTIDNLTDDAANLRCFDQKRRFGVDYLYPVERYVNALKQEFICTDPSRDDVRAESCVNLVPNPLFQDLKFAAGETSEPAPLRSIDQVLLAGIVGVPWQDLALDPSGATPLQYRVAEQGLPNSIDWDLILGLKDATGRYQPGDPLMREQIEPRAGTHPITGEAVASASAGYMANRINGHEWNIATKDDLQYACIFELADTMDCNAGTLGGCDCDSPWFGDPLFANPLCQNPQTGAYGTTQYFAKAYPGIRLLEVLKGVGNNAVVASICPKDPIYIESPDYGYRPAMAALVDRLKEQLKDKRCLPRALPVRQSASGNIEVRCQVLEAVHAPGAVVCDAARARLPVSSELVRASRERLRAVGICANASECEAYQVCEIPQMDNPEDLASCLHDDAATGHGWCYVDPEQGLGDGSQVQSCPNTERRRVRFAANGAPASGVFALLVCEGT